MKKILQEMKNLDIIEPTITIKSKINKQNEEQMKGLGDVLSIPLAGIKGQSLSQ